MKRMICSLTRWLVYNGSTLKKFAFTKGASLGSPLLGPVFTRVPPQDKNNFRSYTMISVWLYYYKNSPTRQHAYAPG